MIKLKKKGITLIEEFHGHLAAIYSHGNRSQTCEVPNTILVLCYPLSLFSTIFNQIGSC